MAGKVKITSTEGTFDEWLEGDMHTLKTWPRYWDAVNSGAKTFEVRRTDRDFKVGDTLELLRWSPETESEEPIEHDGSDVSAMLCKISYILPGGAFGVQEGFCVLGITSKLLLRG